MNTKTVTPREAKREQFMNRKKDGIRKKKQKAASIEKGKLIVCSEILTNLV